MEISSQSESPQRENGVELAGKTAEKGDQLVDIKQRTCQVSEEELRRLVQDEAMRLPDLGLVVSGMAGRFPKADSTNEFEENLRAGLDMVNDQDEARFQCGLWGLPPRAGRLKDLSRFDSEFFGYSEEEANYLDFQLRILYEVVYESILDAGINPANLRGTNTGVFFGLHCNEFENAMADDPAFKSNGYYAQFAVKVAQYFDLRGLTVTFDAACASAFVGFHNAVDALKAGLIDQAIVCSSNIPIHPTGSFIFFQMQMLSPTGYSRFLDSRADGYVKSESCVSVLLQRKHLARRNYCSIMATTTSVDGYKPEGITFPSDKSQERLIREAKEMAQLSTNQIEYLEAHGTGTPAGDPQEARAISGVYYPDSEREEEENEEEFQLEQQEDSRKGRQKRKRNIAKKSRDTRVIGPLLVGSVKTNMGHSEAASGLCALAKVCFMFEKELIYPSLHFSKPNTNIKPLMDGRLKFTDKLRELRAKIIPLSCYGFGGSNVHVIVRANEGPKISSEEQVSDSTSGRNSLGPRLVVMFGRSEEALNGFFDKLLDKNSANTRYCLTDDFLSLVDALSVAKIDRMMNYRGFVLVDRAADGAGQLSRSIKHCELPPLAHNELESGHLLDAGRPLPLQESKPLPCHLLLPGLGSEFGHGVESSFLESMQEMGQFWSTIERLNEYLDCAEAKDEEVNLVDLFGKTPDENRTVCQLFVSIIAFEIATINMVRDQLEVNPLQFVVGHSLGEIACAYASGILNEREAIMLAFHLGKTCDQLAVSEIGGKMVAILGANESELRERMSAFRSIRIACRNGPESVTISGRANEIDRLCKELQSPPNGQTARPLFVQEINNRVALHNEVLMNRPEVKQKLRQAVEQALEPEKSGRTRRVPGHWLSCFSIDGRPPTEANWEYFVEMLCQEVNFGQRFEQLAREDSILLELGASSVFESLISRHNRTSAKPALRHVKLLPRMHELRQGTTFGLEISIGIGRLYQAGASLNLSKFYGLKLDKPVQRGTPSLSSLIGWKHEKELFVPRYPAQFSKSSAKSELPVDLVQDRDKYLSGHCVEGRILYPATGYLLLIWRVFSFTKRKIYDACFHDMERELVPIEFRNVRLMRAVILGNRVAQIYVQLEEATGRFEIKEGGSVVVEGYAQSPTEKPHGLLYEDVRERIAAERLECTMSKDDIYKQFRVNGYDYGETFQNITQCSSDGRFCRVEFNGHFVALTDSILQSIFLAVADYAPPSGGLFLPTRFEYVRFQPEILLRKVHACKMALDSTEGSLDTRAKRQMMNKIMEREYAPASGKDDQPEDEQSKKEMETSEEQRPECYFDTYCDPVTGVIVTDGIEMRGIRASPAPRRVDNMNELLLESQEFVCDFEEPLKEQKTSRLSAIQRPYVKVCDTLALSLVGKLCGSESAAKLASLLAPKDYLGGRKLALSEQQVAAYKSRHLTCQFKAEEQKGENGGATKQQEYDIKKNGPRTLLSVLDQLTGVIGGQKETKLEEKDENKLFSSVASRAKVTRELIQTNRTSLMGDLIQESFTSERFIRPLVEQVVENVCMKRYKLRLLEINFDDAILANNLADLMELVEPQLDLDYSLAHPEPSRLHGSQLDASTKTYNLKGSLAAGECDSMVSKLFMENQHQLRELDFIIYKDLSCYSLPKRLVEENGLAPVVSSLSSALQIGGYCMLMMRQSLTIGERVLLGLSEPELVGLGEISVTKWEQLGENLAQKLQRINEILSVRCKMMQLEAEKRKLICVARKSDENGCLMMLFRRQDEQTTVARQGEQFAPQNDRLVLLVDHQKFDWLDKLKQNFFGNSSKEDQKEKESEVEVEEGEKMAEEKGEKVTPKVVWLCSVRTKRNQFSGLVGMFKSLRRELGGQFLRCFHDEHTFKDRLDEVGVAEVEQSAMFQLALRRDQVWFCVSAEGKLGSFRHLTINDCLEVAECLCSKQEEWTEVEEEEKWEENGGQTVVGAYVNNVTRGDLSSFAWHEAPFKWLQEKERGRLVQVAYSALNFRDIMLASGRLPLDAIPLRLAQSDCLLGLEFAGLLENGSEVGGQTVVRSGRCSRKRVMGMVYGRGLATRVVCPEESSLLLEVPEWLSLEEAATIPVAYATAIMALVFRGRARAGETLLVHAASGGVGQAALHLAAHLKLRVFATVGTEEKRRFLLKEFAHLLTEETIFDSRSCSFEQEVLRATRGRGADLVLNSLADDKLQASLNCLANGGRFLEIGKYDMSLDSKLELLKLEQNKSFHGILLDKLFDVDDLSQSFVDQLKCVKETLELGLKEGFVRPIRRKVFPIGHIEQAFRFMAAGKHIGKVLIEIEPHLETELVAGGQADHCERSTLSCAPSRSPIEARIKCLPRFQLDPSKSYLVTGGLGGFGLELCKWLVGFGGAKHLVISSRSGLKTGYQLATVRRLQTSGCSVRVVTSGEADAAASLEGAHLLCRLAEREAPSGKLGGIFHLAMVLSDGLLENMTSEHFATVLRPKLDVCLNLHEATLSNSGRGRKLDYFVAFSSVTSGKGNAGQANYAYANSCLERICESRRQMGDHALAVQWGAVGDVGVAFERLGGNGAAVGGTLPQRIASCMCTLANFLGAPFTVCSSLLPLNRRGSAASGGRNGAASGGDLVGAIMHVLGIKDASKVHDESTLGELGLDSLMAVEIRQYIEREHDMTLNIQEIRSLTIERIRKISEQSQTEAHKKRLAHSQKESLSQVASSSDGQTSRVLEKSPKLLANGLDRKAASEKDQGVSVANRLAQDVQTRLDKNLVSSYVPKLELPEGDFVRLNYKNVSHFNKQNEQPKVSHSSRPIFFLPPIHGEFSRLETVCATIERPCIGLNWTKRLAVRQTIEEAAGVFLELLQETDWDECFGLGGQLGDCESCASRGQLVVDLVGYSFGATVAFEMMLSIGQSAATLLNRKANKPLVAGHLVLLDGSPKQIELGSKYLSSLTERKPLKLEEKVDELLIVFIISNTNKRDNAGKQVDYFKLQAELRQVKKVGDKIELASKRLASILDSDAQIEEPKKRDKLQSLNEKSQSIGFAMEAFCRKYQLISNYKAPVGRKLNTACTLIRAERLYLTGSAEDEEEKIKAENGTQKGYDQDLGLSSLVGTSFELHIMSGDHETFLNTNHRSIGQLISRKCCQDGKTCPN